MSRKKLTVDFEGFDELVQKLDKAGSNVKKTTSKALKESFNIITPEIEKNMEPHNKNYSGATSKSLVKNSKVEWEGFIATLKVGFDISNGGLPSIFLMYGTPSHVVAHKYGKTKGIVHAQNADKKLYNSIYGQFVRKKVKDKQKEIFLDEIRRII